MSTRDEAKPPLRTRLLRTLVEIGRGMGTQKIRRDGRRFFATSEDVVNGKFVARIVADRFRALAAGQTPRKLVTYRREFRRIGGRQQIAGLFKCLDSENAEALRLAIWLIARSRGNSALFVILPYSQSPDVLVRREAVRAMRRLEAWAELRKIAQEDSDDRVRRLAIALPPKPFDKRFERFAGSLPPTVLAEAPRRRFAFFAQIPAGPKRLAKSPEFIRALLERIRQLVHGH